MPKRFDYVLGYEVDELTLEDYEQDMSTIRRLNEGERVNMRLYVASSWRNPIYAEVLGLLRMAGFDCYDFKQEGFSWRDVDKDWSNWSVDRYVERLERPLAVAGFNRDFDAMKAADACVLILPCGRSAHLEAGFFVGTGKPLVILMLAEQEPELMYKMGYIATDVSMATSYLKMEYAKKLVKGASNG